MGSDLSANVVFDNASKAYALETERMTALAQAQNLAMKTSSIGQKVIEQQLANFRLGLTVNEYQNQLTRFHTKRAKRESEAARLQMHGRNLALYNRGQHLDGVSRQNCWAAFQVFLGMLPGGVMDTWLATAIDEAQAMDSANWLGKSVGNNPAPLEMPASMPNLFSLLTYQLDRHQFVIVKLGTYPFVQTAEALHVMTSAWGAEVARLEAEIAAIQTGTYDLWKVADLVKITEDTAH